MTAVSFAPPTAVDYQGAAIPVVCAPASGSAFSIGTTTVQCSATGMEAEGLKRDFGDRLIFHGAMDNQQTLPFGSPDDVRREVVENYRILGAGGGYILAPCHNIQAVSPPENIVAMYETAYEEGR